MNNTLVNATLTKATRLVNATLTKATRPNPEVNALNLTEHMNFSVNITALNSTNFNASDNTSVAGVPSYPMPEGSVTLAVLVAVLMLLTLVANFFVASVILYYPSLRTTTNHFIFNLCIADILFAVTSMPIWFVYQLEPAKIRIWIPFTYLNFWGILDVLCGTAAILSLTAISVDRYLAITRPLTYVSIMSGRKATVLITLTWLYALTVALLRYLDWPMDSYAFFPLVCSFLLPLTVILLAYGRIFLVAITHARAIESEYATRTSRELKAAQTIFIVILSFVGCWLPFFVASVCLARECANISPGTLNAIKWLTYCNTLLNPLVYTLVNRHFRKVIARKLLARRPPDYSIATQTVLCEDNQADGGQKSEMRPMIH